MEETLQESLAVIFGVEVSPSAAEPIIEPATPAEPEGEPAVADFDLAVLIEEAQQHYQQAQQFLKEGDWAGYGEELAALQAVLQQLAQLVSEEGK